MTRIARPVLALGALAALLVAPLSACGSNDSGSSSGSASSAPAASGAASGDGGKITVFAAASLKKSFGEIGKQVEAAHPGSKVDFQFAGSSDLVTQLSQGAPGDVFASADEKNMEKAKAAGLVKTTKNFASNTLTIVTAPGNPKHITSFADLTKAGVNTVVCAPQVPCGSATEKVEKSSGVTLKPVSEENAVTDVLGKVTSGQADAGVVYVTDAKGAGDKVTAVAMPEAKAAVNIYPIGVLDKAANPTLAQEFVDAVTGEQGQKILADAGFAPAK